MTNKIYCSMQVKEGRDWLTTFTETDPAEVYKSLSLDLINKKFAKVAYIKSIRRVTDFEGMQKITVTYDNGSRRVYSVVRR